MVLLKGLFPIIAGVIFDLLQAGISLGFLGLGSAAGLVPGLGAASIPIALASGAAVNMVLSAMAGVVIGTTLKMVGMFSLRPLLFGAGDFIPIANNLPFWTAAACVAVWMASRKEKQLRKVAAPEPAPVQNITVVPKIGATMALVFTIALTAAPHAHAQAPEPLRYTVSPETPGPNQQVSIGIEGTGTFLGDADITWTLDGAEAKKGPGERTFTFTTGALGTRNSVRVDINSPTEGSFSRSFTITPATVTMLWEADTSVPLLYRGKPLYSAGSPLKVVVYPTVYVGGSRIAPQALSYQWEHNEEPLPQVSGLGRFTYTFSGEQLRNAENILVDIYYGATKVARGELTIPASEARAVMYQYDALRGPLYDSALPSAISLTGSEITFKAEPYYFSNISKAAQALSYTWQLNGSETTGPDAGRGILTLRQTGSGVGEALLGASVQNYDSSSFVQTAETALRIVFGEAPGSALGNLFGL